MELFGFKIERKRDEEEKKITSFVEPADDEGALTVSAAPGGAYNTVVDLEGTAKNEAELVTRYRVLASQPEVEKAVDEIVNDMVVASPTQPVVEINVDELEYPERIKNKIRTEFNEVLKLFKFKRSGYDIVKKWYVDGRLYYHVIIDKDNIGDGIKELRPVDPRKIRKVREVEQDNRNKNQIVTKRIKNEYYVYNDRGFLVNKPSNEYTTYENYNMIKIAKDSIIHCTSGLVNETNSLIISHLHKAIKPANQLRWLEDSVVIYRISRAPERRIFYIDVGNLPKAKAEQYLKRMMDNHKNKLAYDASSGEIRDQRRHMSMLEDFWLPRREGKGTEVTTLPGGQNLGEMEDVNYFQKKLYMSLNVPITRLEPEASFSLGRATEISRDEIKFGRFIERLRTRFSILFNKALEKQLILKGVITPEEWDEIEEAISYDFQKDNHFEELKETEILRERVSLANEVEMLVGKYYSRGWVKKNILRLSDDEIDEIRKEIEDEQDESEEEDDPLIFPSPQPMLPDMQAAAGEMGGGQQPPSAPEKMNAALKQQDDEKRQKQNEKEAKKKKTAQTSQGVENNK